MSDVYEIIEKLSREVCELHAEITRYRARVSELEYAYSKCLAAVGGVQQDAGPP